MHTPAFVVMHIRTTEMMHLDEKNTKLEYTFEKGAPAVHETESYDFYFPPKEDYIARYKTRDGNVMNLESRSYVSTFARSATFLQLSIAADGSLKLVEIKNDTSTASSDVPESYAELVRRYVRRRNAQYFCVSDEFNRMQNYETYIKYRDHYQKPRWVRRKGKRWPKPFRCDIMRDEIDDKTLYWGYPDIKKLNVAGAKPITFADDHSFIDFEMISDYSGTFFPDILYFHFKAAKRVYPFNPHTRISEIKKTLGINEKDPLFYRMAEFHDPVTKTLYFIGTFQNKKVSKIPFTTIVSISTDLWKTSLVENFGHRGQITGFKVHVDSPPIVDCAFNCAVVLSFAAPEILVICLETFAHIKIDLHNWVTDGFLNRWEGDKRSICMTFLSNYTKLVFFPRYSRINRNEILNCDKFGPISTLINWDLVKDTLIKPFFNKKRDA